MENKVGVSISTVSLLPRYKYHELRTPNTIRLMNLLPCAESETDKRLKCELKVASLAENPSFAALSYTWGEDVFPVALICDTKVFSITQNLHDALIHFRLPERVLTIWVDAVCINQADNEEKSLQLPLMDQVYSQATEVLIWLGPELGDSEEVMRYLKRIGQKFLDRGGDIQEPRDERSPENDAMWADVTGDPSLEKTHLIWERPWFSRRWVIQEMALARKAVVHCGTVNMGWDVLFHACVVLGHLRGDGSQFWNPRTGRRLQIWADAMFNVWKLDSIRKEIWASNSRRPKDRCSNVWMTQERLSVEMPRTEFSHCWVYAIEVEAIRSILSMESRRLRFTKLLHGIASAVEIQSTSCLLLAIPITHQSTEACSYHLGSQTGNSLFGRLLICCITLELVTNLSQW